MSTTTTVYGLIKHARGDTPWDVEVNGNFDTTDSEIARPRIPHNTPTVGATTTLDLSLARAFKFTVSQATTLALTNVPANTFHVRVYTLVTNGSAFTLTYPGSVVHVYGVAPTLQSSGVDLLLWETWDAGTTWYVRHVGKNATYSGVAKAQLGGSSLQSRAGVVASQDQTKNTANASETSISLFNLPANTLLANANAVRITAHGLYSGGSGTGAALIKFGATTVATLAVAATKSFSFSVLVTRTGAATQKAVAVMLNDTTFSGSFTSPTETLSNAVTIDFRGNVGTGGSLQFDSMQIECLAA